MKPSMRLLFSATCLSAIAFLQSCSSAVIDHEVQFDLFREPSSNYLRIKTLLLPNTSADFDIQGLLKGRVWGRRFYQQITPMKQIVRLPRGNARQTIKKFLNTFNQQNYVDGVLIAEVQRKRISYDYGADTVSRFARLPTYSFKQGHGVLTDPMADTYTFDEIVQDYKPYGMRKQLRTLNVTLAIRFVLYSRSADRIVHDQTREAAFSIEQYTPRPLYTPGEVISLLTRGLVDRTLDIIAPKRTNVTRRLLAPGGSREELRKDQILVREGFDHAVDENNWFKAAGKWRQAILANKKNPHAHLDLGIYYEKAGDIRKAIEEYNKAKMFAPKRPEPGQWVSYLLDATDMHHPSLQLKSLLPRVIAVTSHHRVILAGGHPTWAKAGYLYPLYRVSPIRPRGSGKSTPSIGVKLVEIGQIQITSRSRDLIHGRLTQIRESKGARAGDLIRFPGKMKFLKSLPRIQSGQTFR